MTPDATDPADHLARRAIPRLAGGLPILGHLPAFLGDPLPALRDGWKRHGELFRFAMLGKTFVLFVGPAAHEAYFRAPDDQLSQREVYQFTVPIFGQGVAYDVPGDLMAEQVGFLHPALRDGRMQGYARQMAEEVALLVADWGDEGEIDLPAVTNELTMNIACRCLLGEEIRSQLDRHFASLYRDLQGGFNPLGFFFPRLPTAAHRRRDRARRAVAEFIGAIIAERRRAETDSPDLMQTLLAARYADGRALGDDEIVGILLTVLFAGQHTSGVLAAWTGIELMQHPDCVAPIRDEIEEIYGAGDSVSLSTLRRQRHLERAIREAERLHPPLVFLVRKVLRDFAYRDHLIPAGALAMVSPALSHRLPTVFADPDRYRPARFVGPDGEDRWEPHALITFGGGRHRCIGTHFAYMQIKIIWSALLAQFDFSLATPPPAPDYREWVTGPKLPCRARYRRRTSATTLQ